MQLNQELLIYRVNVRMNVLAEKNEHHKTILKFSGRKGGRRRVKKGFGTNKQLASEAGKKGMLTRWGNRDKKEEKLSE